MNKKKHLLTILMLLMGLALVACGGTAVSPTPAPAPEAAPTEAPAAEPALTGGQTFVVDTAASEARYIVNEEFFSEALDKLGIDAGKTVVVGRTPGVSGQIELDLTSPQPVQAATFTVDMTGLATDQNRRDNWLRDNAIETGIFPQATFVANTFTGLPETITPGEEVAFQMTGDLTIRNVTNEVTFDVTAILTGDTITGTAVLNLQMTDFGITPPDFVNTLTVANEFVIEVDITARQG